MFGDGRCERLDEGERDRETEKESGRDRQKQSERMTDNDQCCNFSFCRRYVDGLSQSWCINVDLGVGVYPERERENERERKTDRRTDRQKNRQKDSALVLVL